MKGNYEAPDAGVMNFESRIFCASPEVQVNGIMEFEDEEE